MFTQYPVWNNCTYCVYLRVPFSMWAFWRNWTQSVIHSAHCSIISVQAEFSTYYFLNIQLWWHIPHESRWLLRFRKCRSLGICTGKFCMNYQLRAVWVYFILILHKCEYQSSIVPLLKYAETVPKKIRLVNKNLYIQQKSNFEKFFWELSLKKFYVVAQKTL